MLNIHTKHGKLLTNEDLKNLKPLQYNISEQLQFA
uniref:Uncharacterized protein n=1 Tax=virus sp. ctkyY8 TaxID=2827995 RepID=A0A8S5RDY1_9VIRU|nr:MAG TPA: hypothetical protein [virus sp. ctkyY8]